MTLSIQLPPEEQALLEILAQHTGQQQNKLMLQAVRDLYHKILQEEQNIATPYELGKDLFGTGHLAQAPTHPQKRKIWERLHEKHQRSLG
ncbi:MAG: hypothetical protein VSS52_006415 [Thiotrichaceae bacterium]|nr:hypothetical protein [Thiotrichaceae bacterium]